MRTSRLSLRRSLLLSTFFALSLFSAAVSAQNNGNSNTDAASSTPTTDSPTQQQTTTSQKGDNNQQTTTTANNQQTTTTTGPSTAVITATGKSDTDTDPTGLPTITGTSTNGPSKLTGLPTLSKTVDNSIPTYPPPSPPPTQNAPFMQRSNLPDGTVFIAVGAILGAFGATVLIWRGIVACLLHRSVARAAMAQHTANDKAIFPAPPAPFYKYTDRAESSPSVAIGGNGRGVRRTHRGPTPSATPSQTNLFFSPTAPGASGLAAGNNRDSRFLPSGFYAAGSASPANGHGQSISLSNLRPDSRGHARAVAPSPPDSPGIGPRGAPMPRNLSTSSINLNRPPSGRAPSAYLDDLLDDQRSNSGFPPGFPPGPHHQYNHSQSTLGRYGDR